VFGCHTDDLNQVSGKTIMKLQRTVCQSVYAADTPVADQGDTDVLHLD